MAGEQPNQPNANQPAAPAAPVAPAAPAAAAPTSFIETPAGESAKPAGDKPAAPPAEAPALLELKLPEGFDPKSEGVTAFTKLATEAKLTPEAAQKLFDMHAAELGKARAAFDDAAAQHIETARAWKRTVESDPEIGGTNLAASQALAMKAVSLPGGKQFAEFLKGNGLGYQPDAVRFLVAVGRAMGEPSTAGGQPGGGASPKPISSIEDAGKSLYK